MGRTACSETQCLYKGSLYLTFISLQADGLTDIALLTDRVNTSTMQDNELGLTHCHSCFVFTHNPECLIEAIHGFW